MSSPKDLYLHPKASGGGGDPDATAFLTATGITDVTISNAIDTLVSDLKSNSLWNKIEALYPFVGGTAVEHKFNLKDPRDLDEAFRMVFNGGWAHNSLGAISNGTNAYGDTKYNQRFEGTIYNDHLSCYIQSNISNGLIGATTNPTDQILYTGGLLFATLGGGNGSIATPADKGLYLVSRRSDSESISYVNGVSVFTYTSGILGFGNQNFPYYIGCRNDGGVANFFGANTFSFISIGKGFNATEQSNFNTIVATFQSSLNRNV